MPRCGCKVHSALRERILVRGGWLTAHLPLPIMGRDDRRLKRRLQLAYLITAASMTALCATVMISGVRGSTPWREAGTVAVLTGIAALGSWWSWWRIRHAGVGRQD